MSLIKLICYEREDAGGVRSSAVSVGCRQSDERLIFNRRETLLGLGCTMENEVEEGGEKKKEKKKKVRSAMLNRFSGDASGDNKINFTRTYIFHSGASLLLLRLHFLNTVFYLSANKRKKEKGAGLIIFNVHVSGERTICSRSI